MARVRMYADKTVHTIVSHLAGVRGSVVENAEEIKERAEARLALTRDHSNSTNHEVTMTHGTKAVDAFVNLEGPAPLSVEFGHMYHGELGGEPKFVPGKYIVMGAAGLAG